MNGGAIRAHQGSLTLGLCGLTSNQAAYHGGAIAASECAIEMDGCVFTTNAVTTDEDGGGVYAVDGTLDADSCTFTGNTAISEGGGMMLDSIDSAILTDCTFDGNSAHIGGGLRAWFTDFEAIVNSTITRPAITAAARPHSDLQKTCGFTSANSTTIRPVFPEEA